MVSHLNEKAAGTSIAKVMQKASADKGYLTAMPPYHMFRKAKRIPKKKKQQLLFERNIKKISISNFNYLKL